MDIAGKTAVVTGSATGIGRTSAVAIATKGAAKVVLIDVDPAALQEAANLVRAAGAEAVERVFDLSDSAAMPGLFDELEAAGGFDILHNNAGIMSGPPNFPDTPPHRIPLLVAINFTAVMLGTRLAVDILKKRGGGTIINTSSQAALRYGRQEVGGYSDMLEDAPYAASKAGVLMFTQHCRRLKEMFNIRVNAVLPGLTDTPILSKSGENEPADWVKPLITRLPPLTPEKIAEAVITLIEDESLAGEYIHVANT
jgi:NAD(P)-dependent dehydrogenase (short-subunit alcohol dehydrogenase family)